MTLSVHFCGRLPTSTSQTDRGHVTVLDDLLDGPAIIAAVDTADAVYIDDPVSFPWDAMDDFSDTPMSVDISQASTNDLVALRPVLRRLSPHDVLRTNGLPEQLLMARALGVSTTPLASQDLTALRFEKTLDRLEASLINRWSRDFHTVVVEAGDLATPGGWTPPTWADEDDDRPHACVVRVSRSTITAQRSGFHAFAQRLVSQVSGAGVIDLAAIHARPGLPIARGLILIDIR